jgi:hypothetical protein
VSLPGRQVIRVIGFYKEREVTVEKEKAGRLWAASLEV